MACPHLGNYANVYVWVCVCVWLHEVLTLLCEDTVTCSRLFLIFSLSFVFITLQFSAVYLTYWREEKMPFYAFKQWLPLHHKTLLSPFHLHFPVTLHRRVCIFVEKVQKSFHWVLGLGHVFDKFCEPNRKQKPTDLPVVGEFSHLLSSKSIKHSSQRLAFISAIMISALMSGYAPLAL